MTFLYFLYKYKVSLLDIVVAAVGMVISVVVLCVLAVVLVVLVAIVVASVVIVVVVVLMVGSVVVVVLMVGSDSAPELILFLIVSRTNVSIPTPRIAPRTRKRENGLNFHLLSFRVDTCPSLGGLTG